jgi:hypothetical protein
MVKICEGCNWQLSKNNICINPNCRYSKLWEKPIVPKQQQDWADSPVSGRVVNRNQTSANAEF